MEVRRAKEKDLPAIGRMASARLMNSVEGSYLLSGVSDKVELTRRVLDVQIANYYRTGEIWQIGEGQGVLLGHYGTKSRRLANLQMTVKILSSLRRYLTKTDRRQLYANLRHMTGAQEFRWRKQLVGSSNYYFIDLIVIAEHLQGSGAFRRLITPVLQRAAQEKLPVLLDTHDRDNVRIYRHFGFEVAGEHRGRRDPDIVQYSMIKRP